MKFLSTILLAAAISSTVAYDIPTELDDGFYYVPIDSEGNGLAEPTLLEGRAEVHARFAFYENEKRDAVKYLDVQVEKRALPNPQVGCENYDLNRNHFNFYWEQWNSLYCSGNVVNPNWLWYLKVSSVVYYMCNYGQRNPCWRHEYDEAQGLIDVNCGYNRAGWVLIQSWKKGYGRASTGRGLCSWGQVP